MSLLKTVNLERYVSGKCLLKDINIEIDKGEFFVIVGPTGAGKTTLLRLLDVLDQPDAGEIYVEGHAVSSDIRNILKIRRRMSMVFQKPSVFKTSVWENIAYPLKIRGMNKSAIAKKVNYLLDIAGLRGYDKRDAWTLSGGEVQRVAVARAVAADPEILILDEPTANLDPNSARIIESLVINFNKKRSTTIIMTTHDMKQGQCLADRVAVLMDGKLVQVGKPEEVFYAPDNINVANFIGIKNIFHGRVLENNEGIAIINIDGKHIEAVCSLQARSEVDIYLRSDDIVLSALDPAGSARNVLACTIKSLKQSGPLCYVELDCGIVLEALITTKSAKEMMIKPGDAVVASFKATSVRVLTETQAKYYS